MKKIFILLLLFLATKALSQRQLPPAYEIKTDTILNVTLPNTYWQVLEDKDGKLSFDQVRQSSGDAKFHYSKATPQLNLAIHAYWYRYVLKNVMNRDAEICLGSNSEESKYYIKGNNDKWNYYENGESTSWGREKGYRILQIIPIVIKPGEEITIYNQIYNSYAFYYFTDKVAINYGSTKATLQNFVLNDTSYINYVHDSILFGLLLLGALFNFFFFLVVRERVYLYFSLFLICLGIGRMGDEFYKVFFREHRVFLSYLMPFAYLLTFSFLTFFIRSLVQSKRYLPHWDKFLALLNIVYFLNGLIMTCLGLHYYRFYGRINYVFKIALIICNLLTFFLLLGKQKKTDWRLLGAVIPGFVIWGIGYIVVSLYEMYDYTFILGGLTVWLDHWWYYIETLCQSWIVIFFSWILLKRYGHLQKQIVRQALDKQKEKNQLIEQQKIDLEKEVEARTSELNHSLMQLKAAQNQLIQSEKMTSMGELTAGIAHEIQNPLNFVNNFSEVSAELTAELRDELKKGNTQEAIAIATDLEDSLGKIQHHGKRADSIVRGMLQHSRTSTGERQPTNINILADEFLRLSFHGLRAKDKTFNAGFSTHFTADIPKVNVVPQELGRVLLNVFNNAFYAVNEKKKTAGPDYKPEISVTTFSENHDVVITIKDNGTGIPENIRAKIMQPFFTTKPSGEGTGLGLSIAYDMVVKGYGGKIEVNTKEGEYTEFIISLPCTLLSPKDNEIIT